VRYVPCNSFLFFPQSHRTTKGPSWRLVGKARRAAAFSGTDFFSFTLVRSRVGKSRNDFKADTPQSSNPVYRDTRCRMDVAVKAIVDAIDVFAT